MEKIQDLLTISEKGKKLFSRERTVFSTRSVEEGENRSLAGERWNKYVEIAANGTGDMAKILEARKAGLKYILRNFGVYGMLAYFKFHWPHFFRIDYCRITCKRQGGQGACREDQAIKCAGKLLALLKKLSFPALDYFPGLLKRGLFYSEPEEIKKERSFIVSGKKSTAVEKKMVYCAFHPDKKAVFKLPLSKSSICALCRTRSVYLLAGDTGDVPRQLSEDDVLEHLKFEAEEDKNKNP